MEDDDEETESMGEPQAAGDDRGAVDQNASSSYAAGRRGEGIMWKANGSAAHDVGGVAAMDDSGTDTDSEEQRIKQQKLKRKHRQVVGSPPWPFSSAAMH